MSKIKTRESVNNIKLLDKASVVSERMKNGLIRSENRAENLLDDGQGSPSEYAEDKVQYAAGDVAKQVGDDVLSAAKKAAQKGRDSYRHQRDDVRLFMDMIRQMDMSYSYKPVLIKAVMLYADEKGRVKLSDIVAYFRDFYERRRAADLVVEKANSIYAGGDYTDKAAERNILANPFKRFEDMQMLRHTKTLGIVQVDDAVWKRLGKTEKAEIDLICDEKLTKYFERIK